METNQGQRINDLKTTETHSEDKFTLKIDQSVNQIIVNEGFSEYNISKTRIPCQGNYFGKLYKIDVKGKTATGDKELHIFVKHIISNPESVKIVSVPNMYKAELFVYKELSKIFAKLQDEANVPLEERYKIIKAYEQSDADVLLIENISMQGFNTYHRMDVPPLKFFELCVRNLAKFHGLSFVLKEKQPQYFNKKLKPFKHVFIFGEQLKEVFLNTCNIIVKHVDENFKENVMESYNMFEKKLAEYLNDESIKTCMCHGDYKPDNIMMKEEDGEVQEVIAIDYQLLYYGCPALDLLFLIYISTDRDFRKSHITKLKDIYYESLRNFLKFFNLDVKNVYPRNEFDRVFKEKHDYGLIMALLITPLLFVSEAKGPDVEQFKKDFPVDKKMKERIQGIFEDFIELGFI